MINYDYDHDNDYNYIYIFDFVIHRSGPSSFLEQCSSKHLKTNALKSFKITLLPPRELSRSFDRWFLKVNRHIFGYAVSFFNDLKRSGLDFRSIIHVDGSA